MTEHLSSTIFHKSGPANKQHTNQSLIYTVAALKSMKDMSVDYHDQTVIKNNREINLSMPSHSCEKI